MKPPTPTIGMAYRCPLKKSDFKNTSQGKFCDQCSKHIPDMRKKSEQDIVDEIEKGKRDFCGIMDPLMLENPFGDKRDQIVQWYQKLKNKSRSKFTIPMIFAMILITLTGCRRHTGGVPHYSVGGIPILRVHPRSVMEYADASNFVKHNVYKIHLTMKKEKKKKKIKPANK